MKAHLEYLPDPVGVEALGWPSWHIDAIDVRGSSYGDCDDAAALAGALAMAVGARARLVLASYKPDRRLHHIWAEGLSEKGWIEMDPFRSERFTERPTRLVPVLVTP